MTINAVLMHLRRKKPTEALAEEVDSAAANGEASGELGAVDRLNLTEIGTGLRQILDFKDQSVVTTTAFPIA